MEIPSDPFMLLSFVNMKIRDGSYESFDEMCRTLDLDRPQILETLESAGFEYLPQIRQFR